ncbi:hypothetical protein CVT25_000033 [Psilocybe cyanescens]|uniref:Uncharacterized protein n=1 Tax=Psilocybe cyanescens TaxID=93625 RepID=A0A409X4A6_PSICY|nr:hypothetical protein CVT25_000033 [Psilocybe cyanescens]
MSHGTLFHVLPKVTDNIIRNIEKSIEHIASSSQRMRSKAKRSSRMEVMVHKTAMTAPYIGPKLTVFHEAKVEVPPHQFINHGHAGSENVLDVRL